MTYRFINHCYHPTFSVLYGLWEKDGYYYISPDLCRRTPADTTNQYMLLYEWERQKRSQEFLNHQRWFIHKPSPDTIHRNRETLQDPQQLTLWDIQNKHVMYENVKWLFDKMITSE